MTGKAGRGPLEIIQAWKGSGVLYLTLGRSLYIPSLAIYWMR